MNDAEFEAQMNRIRALCDKWQFLLLGEWTVQQEYVREAFETNGEPRPEAIAHTAVRWEYLNAIISWNMPVVARHSDEELEHIFVHECCHVLVGEAREWDDDNQRASLQHEERVVEMIARVIARTRREGAAWA